MSSYPCPGTNSWLSQEVEQEVGKGGKKDGAGVCKVTMSSSAKQCLLPSVHGFLDVVNTSGHPRAMTSFSLGTK